jgi:type I restriction enzyme M protein
MASRRSTPLTKKPVPGPKTKPRKAIAGARSLSSFVKPVRDIMRRSNCASALQYVPELTWILFLRIPRRTGEARP